MALAAVLVVGLVFADIYPHMGVAVEVARVFAIPDQAALLLTEVLVVVLAAAMVAVLQIHSPAAVPRVGMQTLLLHALGEAEAEAGLPLLHFLVGPDEMPEVVAAVVEVEVVPEIRGAQEAQEARDQMQLITVYR